MVRRLKIKTALKKKIKKKKKRMKFDLSEEFFAGTQAFEQRRK